MNFSDPLFCVADLMRFSRGAFFGYSLAENLQQDLGDDYTIIRLMNGEPEDVESEGLASAVGNHMNFLWINDLILFPYYGNEISEQPLSDFKGVVKEHHLPIQMQTVKLMKYQSLPKQVEY